MIIDGEKLSNEILEELKEKRRKFGRIRLAVFLIGKTEEKLRFIKSKEKFAKELNIEFKLYTPDEGFSRKKLRKYISKIVKSELVNGAIIQLPIPEKYKTQYFLNAIPPNKDVDCLCAKNLGKFFSDSYIIRPPSVEVVDFIKNKFKFDFVGKLISIVGYGNLVGKPISHYLIKEGGTVIVINSKTNEMLKNLFLRKSDVIISGVGKKNIVNDCKKGAIIIDFGYCFNGKIYGDVNFEKLKNKAELITPTPGGTGPILTAMLYKNLLKLLEINESSHSF